MISVLGLRTNLTRTILKSRSKQCSLLTSAHEARLSQNYCLFEERHWHQIILMDRRMFFVLLGAANLKVIVMLVEQYTYHFPPVEAFPNRYAHNICIVGLIACGLQMDASDCW
jgi:hypothetical protein